MAEQIEDARKLPSTSGTTLLLGAGMVVASLGHGAIIASLVFAFFISWWAIPLHLLCVWFTGNMAGNKGRNRNIGHALGLWLGVLGVLLALALDSTKDDSDQQALTTTRVLVFTILGIVAVSIGGWIVLFAVGASTGAAA